MAFEELAKKKKKKKTLTSFKFDEIETVTHKSSQNNPTTYKMLKKKYIGFKQGAIGICILGGNWLKSLMCNPSKHENRIRRVSEEVL